MFFIKVMLIILLNETFAYITQNDTETVILPAKKPTCKKKVSFTLKNFGRQIQLNLYRNKTTSFDPKGKLKLSHLNTSDFCYYHHNDNISSAVINFRQKYGWEGFVFLEDNALEIRPLQNDFAFLTLTDNSCVKEETNISFGKLHRIRRSLQLYANSSFYNVNVNNFKMKRHVQDTQEKLTVELAVFLDDVVYRVFKPILNGDEEKLRNIILAYVNNIQAVFHHPSLGVPIDISLVHFEVMKKVIDVPLKYTNYSVELVTKFCEYVNTLNPENDDNPSHWDVALYLTGLNLYYLNPENQEKDYDVFGLASFNTTCVTNESCVIVEFGVDRELSSGFPSSLTAVHEIAHLFGILHDEADQCQSFNHIMAFRQYHRGQVTWSECSRNAAKKLWDEKECLRDRTTPEKGNYTYDHSRYKNLPGREWNAKAQCEIFFRDENANVVSLIDICQVLQCETPHAINFTGPPLEGTYCAYGKECRGGECVPMCEPPNISKYDDRMDSWSEWKADSCKSACLDKSKGVVIKRRFCTHHDRRTANCRKPYYDVALCDDSLLCANEDRSTVFHYSERKCIDFMLLAEVKSVSKEFEILKQHGMQSLHDVEKPWIACTIFCAKHKYLQTYEGHIKRHDYYASSLEIGNLGVDPYFPDGTWCHHKDGQDYYCRRHYCLPENYSFNSQEVQITI